MLMDTFRIITGIVGGIVGATAAWTGHQHIASVCILTMCGLYFLRRRRAARAVHP